MCEKYGNTKRSLVSEMAILSLDAARRMLANLGGGGSDTKTDVRIGF
jgi:hypothetical protein